MSKIKVLHKEVRYCWECPNVCFSDGIGYFCELTGTPIPNQSEENYTFNPDCPLPDKEATDA